MNKSNYLTRNKEEFFDMYRNLYPYDRSVLKFSCCEFRRQLGKINQFWFKTELYDIMNFLGITDTHFRHLVYCENLVFEVI